jgi:ATPase family associated with various cellular activities (AAA)
MNAMTQPCPFEGDVLPSPCQTGDGPPAAELVRLDALIERAVLRLRTRYQLSLAEMRGLYVSDARVDELLAAATAAGESGPSEIDHRIDGLEAELNAAPTGAIAWHQLAAALRLTRAEKDVLLVTLAPDIDAKYAPLLAYLNDDAGCRWATPDLIARLFRSDTAARARRLAGSPAGRLFEYGLIEWHPGARDTPGRAQRGLRVPPPLAEWLCGLPYVDERLDGIARWLWPEQRPPLPAGAATDAAIERLARTLRDDPADTWPVVCVMASHAAEAFAVARELFGRAERRALRIDLNALRAAAAPREAALAARLANTVFGAGLILGPASALASHEPAAGLETITAVRDLCERANGAVLVDADRSACARLAGDGTRREYLDLPVTEPALTERIVAWQSALAATGGTPPATDVNIAVLAGRFALGPARIAQTTALARRRAALDGRGRLDTRSLLEAARSVCAASSTDVTRTVQTVFEWEDLVLPPVVHERLSDIVRAVELRARVLDQWGFERRLGVTRGVKAMFAGASGTGKSMAAALIAKTLALELHRIELSAVVSKYIGETEKNLDRAFEAARSGNAILFIDEADALFGKRSEVKDAHDRYANVETAYLLQKMEDHDGMVILATNLANNIDNAFSRRMHFVVEFPLPDVRRRERLWRGMFPASAPVAADLDFGFLARQFGFAGGDIRNIVLDAAYAAAQQDEPISMAHVLHAVARQYAKLGKVPSASEFREHYGILLDPRSLNGGAEARAGNGGL